MKPQATTTIRLIRKWAKKLCVACHEHRAVSVYRGRWKFRRDLALCRKCFEAACDRDRSMVQTRASAHAHVHVHVHVAERAPFERIAA